MGPTVIVVMSTVMSTVIVEVLTKREGRIKKQLLEVNEIIFVVVDIECKHYHYDLIMSLWKLP